MERWYGTLRGLVAPPAAPHSVSVLEPPTPPREGLAHGQPLQLCDAAQEPASRSHVAYPSDGPRSDRPCLELWGVWLAASAYRSRPHHADGRTACTAADPGSPGPTSWQDPSTTSCRGARSVRKRDSPSAESRVRCSLLFSRTTEYLRLHFLMRGQLRRLYGLRVFRCAFLGFLSCFLRVHLGIFSLTVLVCAACATTLRVPKAARHCA